MSARRNQQESYTLSGSPPTSTALATLVTALRADVVPGNHGVAIDDGRGVTAVVSVDSAKTIVSGAMRCYAWMPTTLDANNRATAGRWVRYPNLDVDLITDTNVGASTERDIPLGDKIALSGVGRLAWLPDAVVGSTGATTLLVTHMANRWS